jgi:hypothetical protein
MKKLFLERIRPFLLRVLSVGEGTMSAIVHCIARQSRMNRTKSLLEFTKYSQAWFNVVRRLFPTISLNVAITTLLMW